MELAGEKWGGQVVWVHRGEDKQVVRAYRRIVGGLAWPSPPEPGFLVAAAEELEADIHLGKRRLWVLAEQEARGVGELHRASMEWTAKFKVRGWYGNPGDRAMVELFNRENHGLSSPRQQISVLEAPYCGDADNLGIYGEMVRGLLQPHRKVLNFGAESRLPGLLLSLAPQDYDRSAGEYPPLAALGYAVAALQMREPINLRGVKVLAYHDHHVFKEERRGYD